MPSDDQVYVYEVTVDADERNALVDLADSAIKVTKRWLDSASTEHPNYVALNRRLFDLQRAREALIAATQR